ncbi:MAG TPA: hypothetical protein VM370_04560 [Candidatus Thermoplasmatota archaeon]|nr:hypothetical protein [Candidatus Thermoplasmatota archaeon]
MPDLSVTVHVARPPEVVRQWWLDFPEVYENAREQPHRIVTRSRSAQHIDTLTYWRGPLGREIEVPERFALRADGWDVDIALPFGLAQRDQFALSSEPGGTRVDIEVDIWCRTRLGRLSLAGYKAYARRSYPRTWRAAARWCEAATV